MECHNSDEAAVRPETGTLWRGRPTGCQTPSVVLNKDGDEAQLFWTPGRVPGFETGTASEKGPPSGRLQVSPSHGFKQSAMTSRFCQHCCILTQESIHHSGKVVIVLARLAMRVPLLGPWRCHAASGALTPLPIAGERHCGARSDPEGAGEGG